MIRQEAFSDLQLGTRRLSLLDELGLQAEVLMARYRSGDGTGLASVTPATSCVQDSAQALFIAIRRLGEQVRGDRAFAQLSALARSLEDLLTPFGMVRSDWKQNVAAVANPAGDKAFRRGESLRDALLSWRSMLPRRAHDDINAVFLKHDAALWFVRTNQVPGLNRELVPLAPTLLFGQIPWLSTLLRRLTDALFTPLSLRGTALTLLVLGGYAALALPLGTRTGFLPRRWIFPPVRPMLRGMAGLLLMPALSEELVFRVALLPHPLEGVGLLSGLAWGALSVGLFVLYHPLAGATWYPAGRMLFRGRSFLGLCALLGVACVLAYNLTGSVWAPVLIHWLVVSLWLWPLQGLKQLEGAGGGAKIRSSSPSWPWRSIGSSRPWPR
jgi:predicted Abi (CAAX) family protease